MNKEKKILTEETIAAISTPVGEGGIGIVRLSGPSSATIIDKIFSSGHAGKISKCATHTVHYGHIKDPGTSEVLDEVIVTLMRAPKSYTKEDIVEINCHGGIQSVRKVLELTVKQGARIAEPGEFTKRAFLNGRIDLAQAEAVLDVIRAKTEGSLKVAMAQLDGELSRSINDIRDKILDVTSEIEASIDFPEEDIEESERNNISKCIDDVIAGLNRLIGTYDEGQIFREGVLAVICGRPNAGKSSLMNLLLKRDRVIVSPIPGTTRDAVEEMISLRGIPIRLTDTAGIIDTEDILEKEGIVRSKRYLDQADIVVLLLDASVPLDDTDKGIMKMCRGKKMVTVLNKTDIPRRIDMKSVGDLLGSGRPVEISVKNRKNIDNLEKELAKAVLSGGFNQGQSAILNNARHKELLDKALSNMLSVKKALKEDQPPETLSIELKEAITALGLVVGKSISDDILDRIFERFCIGK